MRTWNPDEATVGAEVVILRSWPGPALVQITAVTRTQVKLANGTVLDRATGRIRGASDYGSRQAYPATDSDREGARRTTLVQRLSAIQWRTMSTDTLEAVAKLALDPPATRP